MLKEEIERFELKIDQFISTHISIKPINSQNSKLVFISVEGDHFFKKLDGSGILAQKVLITEFNSICAQFDKLLTTPKEAEQIERTKHVVQKIVMQNSTVFRADLTNSKSALSKLIENLQNQYLPRKFDLIVAPDTNIFYHNNQLEQWKITGFNRFEILIAPTVFLELDKHKTEHNIREIKNKAQKIVRQFKEYRRRGKLNDGIKINGDRVILRAKAAANNSSNYPDWLNHKNMDDLLLIHVLNEISTKPHERIAIMSEDNNLLNKCELLSIPYVELDHNSG